MYNIAVTPIAPLLIHNGRFSPYNTIITAKKGNVARTNPSIGIAARYTANEAIAKTATLIFFASTGTLSVFG